MNKCVSTRALHCSALHCTALHCTVFCSTARNGILLHCTLHCITLHCITLYFSALHLIVFFFTALYTAPYKIVQQCTVFYHKSLTLVTVVNIIVFYGTDFQFSAKLVEQMYANKTTELHMLSLPALQEVAIHPAVTWLQCNTAPAPRCNILHYTLP